MVGWLVTRMNCDEMAGWIEMPLGTSVGLMKCHIQGDHLSGKPGTVREFNSCQQIVRDFTKKSGKCREKSCQGKVA